MTIGNTCTKFREVCERTDRQTDGHAHHNIPLRCVVVLLAACIISLSTGKSAGKPADEMQGTVSGLPAAEKI